MNETQRVRYNQYWYSSNTAAVLVAVIEEQIEEEEHDGLAVAFLSTPSLYHAVSPALRARSRLFDLDEQWASDPNFVRYDFKQPEAIPTTLHGRFSMVVMDPPFITREVWELYAPAARMLLRPQGPARILATTVQENAGLMAELFGTTEQRFKPAIPNLIYQFSLYSNFDSSCLAQSNPEVVED